MKIISCNSNRPLSESIAANLGRDLTHATIKRFADEEVFVEIHDNVRGEDVFVIQPTSSPANDNLMELLVTLDALRRASARSVTAVVPYFGYARQDRRTNRTPISAKLVANLITTAGADRVVTMDLHAAQIQGFFDIPVDNLYAAPMFAQDLRRRHPDARLTVVSPDIGGVLRARTLATRLGCDLAIIDKRRERAGVSEVMNVIGPIGGADCILVDDMCDSGGTLCNAATALMGQGAASVEVYITHGVLSGDAVGRISDSPIRGVTLTDSIRPPGSALVSPKFRVLSVAPLFAEAMRRINSGESVSSLFD